jgi:hypothetical protein
MQQADFKPGGNMSVNNPYDAPKSNVEDTVAHSDALDQVASGQRLIIYSIVLGLGAMIMDRSSPGPLVFALVIIGLVLSIIGMLRLCNGMGYSTLNKVFLIITLFIPIVSLLVLVSLSIRATGRLKEAGYKVGLFGAKR